MFGINPFIVFSVATAYAVCVFLGVWYFLNYSRNRYLKRWSFIDRFLKKARQKGETPFIRKYGLFGLAMLMAVPFPTIGVYGATSLTWMLGKNQWRSMAAVISGVTVSNGIVLSTALGLIHVVSVFG
ncbi:MAG: small multi-drug export protein [Dehalococcoidales bacterium]|mgnify:CR=1 FL=1|nr:small multi-drug export protein [Dehalococcoidales bacterium]